MKFALRLRQNHLNFLYLTKVRAIINSNIYLQYQFYRKFVLSLIKVKDTSQLHVWILGKQDCVMCLLILIKKCLVD